MQFSLDTMLAVSILIAMTMNSTSCASIPDLSLEALKDQATDIVTGKVLRVYTMMEEPKDGYQVTRYLFEIAVDQVEKGQRLKPHKLVNARAWVKQFVGPGSPAPGHNGHRSLPAVGSRVSAYLRVGQDGGNDALEPNGLR